MKVKDLIPFLERAGENAEVLLASDEEGNSFSPVDFGFAEGNFDNEKDNQFKIADAIYTMDENEMHGDYIILYPR